MEKISVIALLVTSIAVIVSIVALILQLRRSKFALSVELLQKLDERFNCPDFYKKRKAAIESIKSKTFSDIHEILDFFETIGLLLKRGAVDKEMVWSTFYWWI